MSESRRVVPAGSPARLKWMLLLAAIPLTCLAGFVAWPIWANLLGLGIGDGWFIDLYALLAAAEAHAQGLDIHALNPLDLYGRPHSYSSWWLVLSDLGLTRSDTRWLGVSILAVFFALAVGTIRPATSRACWFSAVLLASPAVQLALVRANNDLVIFIVLAALVPCLCSPRPVARMGAVAAVALAIGLKYYPAVALLLLLHEDSPRLFVWRIVLGLLFCTLVMFGVYEDTLYFASTLPAPAVLYSFGASAGLAYLHFGPGVKWSALAMVITLGGVAALKAGPGSRRATREELYFVLGAVLISACFWATMNWAYRWVFSLWFLPLLLGPQVNSNLVADWQRRMLRWLLPIAMWWDGLVSLFWNLGLGGHFGASLDRYSEVGWLSVQPVHWAVATLLSLTCVRFAFAEMHWLCRRLKGAALAPAV